ncbi:hypothetical protein [Pontibacter sp. SGAir0037]|uniref:hypothetical protein n=1 Tax=Pontibacter sp. SGAir0037 TaxID=2571030 RepID=UPI0010F4A007|nr:hypothetical protein [Pontibacter sp. SGAir0037]
MKHITKFLALAMFVPLAFSCTKENESTRMTSEADKKTTFKAPSDTMDVITQTPSTSKVYEYAEQMPQYNGGEKAMIDFLASNIQYPSAARAAKVEGMVVFFYCT